MDWMAALAAAVKVKILALVAQEIPHQHLHHKVTMAVLAALLLAAAAGEVVALRLLELLQQAHLAALAALVQPQVLLGHQSHTAAVAAVETNHLALVVLAALAVVVRVVQAGLELLAQQILVVVAVVVALLEAVQVLLAAQAVQASSSFHTQAQHNYLVVALLPNQAVTSFTHSHLLAHLALCHL
jgi:hypothetical protein